MPKTVYIKKSDVRYPKSYGLNKTEKKQTKQIVKRAINSTLETKTHYHSRVTDVEFTVTNPVLVPLLNIPQGTDDWEREGDEFLFKHLKINLDITGSVDGTVKSGLPVDRVRVMLVKWRESDYQNGTQNFPALLDIFANQLPTGTHIHTAMVNHEENNRRFKVLYDKKLTLCGDIGAMLNCDSPEKKQRFLSINIPQKKYGNKKVKYDSQYPNTNAHMNGLFLFVWTDNTGGATQSGPTVSIDSRLLFKDA